MELMKVRGGETATDVNLRVQAAHIDGPHQLQPKDAEKHGSGEVAELCPSVKYAFTLANLSALLWQTMASVMPVRPQITDEYAS